MSKIVLLQHGPKGEECVARTVQLLAEARDLLVPHDFSVVLQHYDNDVAYAEAAIAAYRAQGFEPVVVPTADVFNPGFFNINRQSSSVGEALSRIGDDALVIKLRNDQSVDFGKLFDYLKRYGFLDGTADKLFTTNCFARGDRWYHPSDMFLCGSARNLKAYYSIPHQEQTHRDIQLRMVEMAQAGTSQRHIMLFAPESMLFTHYLRTRGWDFKYTDDDSMAALRTHCHLVNSWNIDYSWEKKRTPMVRAGGLILPQNNFASTPFPGGPSEHNRCIDEAEFYGHAPSVKDRLYHTLSEVLFGLQHSPAGFLHTVRFYVQRDGLKGFAHLAVLQLKKRLQPLKHAALATTRTMMPKKPVARRKQITQVLGLTALLILLLPLQVLINRR